jgi:hypothetical protein
MVLYLLNYTYNEEVRKNRILLTYLIDVTVTLAKQELAFRGRDKSNNSFNIRQFQRNIQSSN